MIEYNGNIACEDKVLCTDVRLKLEGGECVLLCGANGSGKTTLLRGLAEKYPEDIMLIPTGIPKVKGFTLREFIATGCSFTGRAEKIVETAFIPACERLGITALSGRDISTLSDGEFQKACIAIGLCCGKKVLMLDEPTAYLDPQNRITILSCLHDLASEGRSTVFSSHELTESLRFCNAVWAIGHDRRFHSATGDSGQLRDAASAIFPENA